jgi:histidyl-tRNA synthetase
MGVRFALILGENEVNSGQYALKNLSTGEQASVSKAQISGIVRPLSAIPKRSEGSL